MDPLRIRMRKLAISGEKNKNIALGNIFLVTAESLLKTMGGGNPQLSLLRIK